MGWPVGGQAVGGWSKLPLAGGHGVEDEASWSRLPCRACHRWGHARAQWPRRPHRKHSLLRWEAGERKVSVLALKEAGESSDRGPRKG